MSGDFSRFRHNPLRDFASVNLKQGGVVLDADTNEGAEIADRRLRALASDVLGRATVSQTTPDAFKLSLVSGGSSLTIGKGRMYVDGHLVENHGAPKSGRGFDPLLAETTFSEPVRLEEQPYLPDLTPPVSGYFLVYLDTWQRELTHVESPDLVEIAVGVETSSRVQTAWQVRLRRGPRLRNLQHAGCAAPRMARSTSHPPRGP